MSSYKNPALIRDPKSGKITLRTGFYKKRVQPQFAKEADINLIAARFLQTGQLPISNSPSPIFGDASMVPKGTDALALRRRAMQFFEQLPLPILKRFDFSLTQFANQLSSEEGINQLRELLNNNTPSPSPTPPPPPSPSAPPAAPPSPSPTPSPK